MFAMSIIVSVIFFQNRSVLVHDASSGLSEDNRCGGYGFPAATRLCPHAGPCRNRVIPAFQCCMFCRDRKAGCLGRKVDSYYSRNVGDREFISRNKRSLGEPDGEVRGEIPDALPASFDQRRDLIVIMRSGNGPVLETRNSVANRFHDGGKSFLLSASFPHCHQRLGLRRSPEQ